MIRQTMALVAAVLITSAPSYGALVQYNDVNDFLNDVPGATLINFDDDPNGNPTPNSGDIGNTYSAWGVTFSPGNVFEDSFILPQSPPRGWLNNTSGQGGHVFDADFGPGINAAGVFNVRFAGTSTMTAFDLIGNVLGSVTGDSDGNTLDFFGLTTMSDIARIEIVTVNGGWGLDDLYVGRASTNAVPEPATMALFGIGALGLTGVVRRRRSV